MLFCARSAPLHPALGNVVDAFGDIEILDVEFSRSYASWCVSHSQPVLSFHYRAPARATLLCEGRPYRHLLIGPQTRPYVVHATGAVGHVSVVLKPQAAAHLMAGGSLRNASVDLGDVFGRARIARLQEQLEASSTSAERLAHVEALLLETWPAIQPDATVQSAMRSIRDNPSAPMEHVARGTGLSLRQLSRRFQRSLCMSPKQLARIERVSQVIHSRFRGHAWTDIAHGCGYSDQAHLVHEFTALVGASPSHFCRATSDEGNRLVNDLWIATRIGRFLVPAANLPRPGILAPARTSLFMA